MLKRTHLAIGIAVTLYFVPFVNNKFVFVPVVLIASLLPDIDSGFSTIGKHKVFRPLQWVAKHRGIFHTYTLCIAATMAFALFYPVVALPFFMGYSSHLFADMFTPQGIKPFWPLKKKSTGHVTTGGKVESTLFYIFVAFDLALLVKLFI